MEKLRVENIVKIYPCVKPGVLGRKRAQKLLEQQAKELEARQKRFAVRLFPFFPR